MPLLLSKRISPYSAYAVWNIQETNGSLMRLIKEPAPQDLHPTRTAEWIVGRILISNLCMQFGLKYRGVSPDEFGKPYLTGLSAQISISHSFPMAAAMIDLNHACGIDLERPRAKLISTQHKFLNDKESAYENDLQKLCTVWCGKEVLYKIYGRKKLSLKDETEIRIDSDSAMTGKIFKEDAEKQYKIHYEELKDYIMAYSI